jgi:hypothetical protein
LKLAACSFSFPTLSASAKVRTHYPRSPA